MTLFKNISLNSISYNICHFYIVFQPTALISRRPDSKDLSRSQFKALPKIQAHRRRNDTSTVFEREPWANGDDPPLARETEYKQNYLPDHPDGMEFKEPLPERLYVSDSEKHSVMMLVPRNVLLPSDPIVLPRDKEVILCKLICIELEGFDERKLREIYVDASLRDPELNGYCDIQYLDSVLRQHGVRLICFILLPEPCLENRCRIASTHSDQS